jgi:hypothetical protein
MTFCSEFVVRKLLHTWRGQEHGTAQRLLGNLTGVEFRLHHGCTAAVHEAVSTGHMSLYQVKP